jgi:sulfur carrier protein ThiS
MHITSKHRNTSATACGAAFVPLREEIAREVSGSAMLADLLEKLNGMQEACARPADFKKRFDEFIVRSADHLDIVQPFLPKLGRFLPA